MDSKVSQFVALLILVQLTQIHSSPATQNPLDDPFASKENEKQYPPSMLYVFGGEHTDKPHGHISALNTVFRMNSTTGEWETVNHMLVAEEKFCGVVSGKKIYLFGGFQKAYDYNDKERDLMDIASVYDSSSDSYTILRSMPDPRAGCGAAVLDGVIYVSGGTIDTRQEPTSTLLRYDIRGNHWATLKPMHYERYGHQLLELNGLLYAFGGSPNGTVEVYNTTTNQWSFAANTLTFHSYPFSGATVHEGKIYAYLPDYGFEIYNPNNGQWKDLENRPDLNYYNNAVVSMNGKLWALGGSDYTSSLGWTETGRVDTFDPSTNHWTRQADMNGSRGYLAAFVVEN